MDEPSGVRVSEDDFRRLLEAEIPRLRRVAARIAPAGTDPDDLTHDALERAWRSRESFRGDSAISTWLYRIVTNRAADLAVRRSTVPVDVSTLPEEELAGLEVEDPATLLERAAEGQRMRTALARLGAVDRVMIVLHDGEGMPVKQIAQACGLAPATAHKRLQRARVRLVQAFLDPATGDPSAESRFCLQCCEYAADYLNDELDEGKRAAIEAHLRACDRCPPLAQAAIGLREVLEKGIPASGLHDQLTSALRADSEPEDAFRPSAPNTRSDS
jgi:RNA polymerase sigma factor (sigma-70 family)